MDLAVVADAAAALLRQRLGLASEPEGDGICEEGTYFAFWFGWFMAITQMPLVYIPQYMKLVKGKTHIGLSLPNCLAFCVVTYLMLVNYVCAAYAVTFECCRPTNSGRECAFAVAPFLQTIMAWFGCVLTLAFYYLVYDKEGLSKLGFDVAIEGRKARQQCWMGLGVHLVLTFTAVLLAKADGSIKGKTVAAYGAFCNVACSILISVHWVFQIVETRRAKCIGGLSIFSLLISAGGCVVSAFTFYEHGGWSVSLSYCCGAIAIGSCVSFAIHVDRKYPDGPPSSFISRAESDGNMSLQRSDR